MASTSASSIERSFKYDVFLSFRGEDTRKTFVDHLYHALHQKGIITYKDDEKIEKGERISEQLIRSIEESRFYIIVFSKNYASSSWCLEELVKIMECQKMEEHTAYPVFFDVEPTEVRNQSGAVGEAFARHVSGSWSLVLPLDCLCSIVASCCNGSSSSLTSSTVNLENEDDVGRWRNAMKEAAGLAGMELKNAFNGHEAKCIQQIVQEVSLKLHFFNSKVDGNLVGMETRVKNVLSYLEIGVDDVRMIGIWGMGGSGKTTLARAVFDYISIRFEGKSFVENVREVSKGYLSGMKKLQKLVLKDVLKDQRIDVTSVSDGIDMMKKMIGNKKILIVLDDVDDVGQLEALAGDLTWFKPGSRIIITTRDEQVLKAHRVNYINDACLLSQKEAICLFSRYAFGRETPNKGYKELSRMIVRYAAGLPLTIKVLGSSLCGRIQGEWEDTIERLKTIPLKETFEKLKLSYNGLENDQKEIFLDIACILKGETKKNAIRILESCGFRAQIGLRVLEQKSLVSISKDDSNDSDDAYNDVERLLLHDHIEEMGMNIVRRLHPNEPKRHSRLWIQEEIEDILVNESGTEETKCIKLEYTNLHASNIEKGLKKMKELRFLYVECSDGPTEVDELSRYLPDALQYLYWHEYPFCCLPKTFQANKIVNLEMVDSNISQLWEGGERKILNKLKFLDLRNSKLRTFDLTVTPHLEELNLGGCSDFVELQLSVECPNLKVLNLSGSKVSNLNLGLTPNLESLYLRECWCLQKVHAPVGSLKKLVLLLLEDCSFFLSFTFNKQYGSADIESVATLDIYAQCVRICPLHPKTNLPDIQFECKYDEPGSSWSGNLEKLISSASGLCACKNREYLSATICDLQHLRELTLQSSIPGDLWQLESLEKLFLWHVEIRHLADSICMLKHLKSLPIGLCVGIEQLLENICRLECLEELDIEFCSSLRDIPNNICNMKRLKRLNLTSCCQLEKLPEELGRIECLNELNIEGAGISCLPLSIFQLKGLRIFGYRGQLESYGFTSFTESSVYLGSYYVEL